MATVVSSFDEDELLDIHAAAKLLGVSRFFIWDHLHRKKPLIPHVKISRYSIPS
jgi:predicted DNA-binding transcriptional regulator AlpA